MFLCLSPLFVATELGFALWAGLYGPRLPDADPRRLEDSADYLSQSRSSLLSLAFWAPRVNGGVICLILVKLCAHNLRAIVLGPERNFERRMAVPRPDSTRSVRQQDAEERCLRDHPSRRSQPALPPALSLAVPGTSSPSPDLPFVTLTTNASSRPARAV
jgi:hypothetical protein